MPNIISPYPKILANIRKMVRKLDAQLSDAEMLFQENLPKDSYEASFQAVDTAEKLTLLLRSAPVYTGIPQARQRIQEVLAKTIPITMGYTKEGWFYLRLPSLLPKKESGSVDFLRGCLTSALDNFFSGGYPKRFGQCVLIYRHVYDQNMPEREWRDHDNIEINFVTDRVAQYVMTDDAPKYCRHFYCSAKGEESATQVFVVPRNAFPQWLAAEEKILENGLPEPPEAAF